MIKLNSPLDMHCHLRQGDLLKSVAYLTAKHFAGALIMPNIDPIIDSEFRLVQYKTAIDYHTYGMNFTPYMTLYFQEHYSKKFLEGVKDKILAIKFYPKNLTTNSQHGCDPNSAATYNVLGFMEELKIPLCVHAEYPGYHQDREWIFNSVIRGWAQLFPTLKIIIEHISDRRSLDTIYHYDNVYGTVTPHHLLLTGDDYIGPPLNVHNYCMPVCKRPEDRAAIQRDVLNGNQKLMLGTDSAPHYRLFKLDGCAGVFNAPIALQLITELFVNEGAESKLQDFVAYNARRIYHIMPPDKFITLVEKDFIVPKEYDGVVPLFAGKTLKWSIDKVD